MDGIELKINEEALESLFQGKKVVFDYHGQPRVTLLPPRYGVFMTYEKYTELVRKAEMEGLRRIVELLNEIKPD